MLTIDKTKLEPPIQVEKLIPQAVNHIQNNNIQDAILLLTMVLDERPNNVLALSWCAYCDAVMGNHANAIILLERATKLSPNDAQILSNLGQSYIAIGDNTKAKICFEKAYGFNKNDAEANYYLGYFAQISENFDDAIVYYKRAIENNKNLKNAYIYLADIYHRQKQDFLAFKMLCTACEIFPNDNDILYLKGRLTSKSIDGWHLPMLADNARNDAYFRAIKSIISPDDIVLDIGTGSGLLAMMAASLGAKHVYAIEQNVILAGLAREIIELNGFKDKITIIPKNSSDIVIGVDIPDKANLLVTEIFDCAVIGENALMTIDYAKKNLLTDDAKIIPEAVNLYGILTNYPELQKYHNVSDVCGFDLSLMTHIANSLIYKDANFILEDNLDKIISQEFLINKFDFTSNILHNFVNNRDIKIVKNGYADSVVMYFTLDLAPNISFSTRNDNKIKHWKNPSQILLNPQYCFENDILPMTIKFNGYFDFS